jgi:mRNA interferase MazF
MRKDYTQWHKKKIEIEHGNDERLFFHEREVWWCSTGSNVGFEQDGKGENFARPVLIFKKFNKEIFWGIPLSTKVKTTEKTAKFYFSVNLLLTPDTNDGIERVAILSQMRLIDGKRLISKMGFIDEANYQDIQKAVINLCSS